MHKTLLLGIAIIITIGVSFFAFNTYIYNEKQGGGGTYEPYRATLTGEYVCLPHTDQTGPQTMECAYGMRTDTGEYYAIDLSLMSQSHHELALGQRFTAHGVVTQREQLSSDHWQKYPIIGIFSVTDSLVSEETSTIPTECPADAKICPDGSAVGRTGARCEFAACPLPKEATSSALATYLGGSVTGMNITISPQEIISDSRCPSDVTCVWAGTVEVRTTITSQMGHGEHVLTLGTPQVFGDYTITMTEVTPEKTQQPISDSSYRFTFEIVER